MAYTMGKALTMLLSHCQGGQDIGLAVSNKMCIKQLMPILMYCYYSNRQVEDASEVSSMATQAYDTASTAYNMARDALEQQHKMAT